MNLEHGKYINPLTDFNPPTEREAYEERLKYYRDLKNVVDTAEEKGREARTLEPDDIGSRAMLAKSLDPQKTTVLPLTLSSNQQGFLKKRFSNFRKISYHCLTLLVTSHLSMYLPLLFMP